MIVAPSGKVELIKGVRITSSYADGIVFADSQAQYDYFHGKMVLEMDLAIPVLLGRNTVRMNCKADDAFGCCYMMFQNSDFGNKWYYAFIESVDYVNVNCCSITYKIDVLNTWAFEFQRLTCFVERCHTSSDNYGEHDVDEGISVGDYVKSEPVKVGIGTGDWSVIVADPYNQNDLSPTTGGNYAGIFSGLHYHQFSSTDLTAVNDYISRMITAGKENSIVAMYMCPSRFVDSNPVSFPWRQITKDAMMSFVDGKYRPKNKKMYLYPFSVLHCENNQGSSANFWFENFEGNNCDFNIAGDCTPTGEIMASPLKYLNNPTDYGNAFKLQGLPQCSYNSDSYKSWLAQNAFSNVGTYVSSVAGSAGAILSGNVAGGLTNMLGTAFNMVNADRQAQMQADHAHGVPSYATGYSRGLYDFFFYYYYVHPRQAKSIDNFFTKFGYAQKSFMVPPIANRPVFTYVKTQDAKIAGNVPSVVRDEIVRIFDSGITWWKNGDQVGDYSLDNSV